jgi:hypothetical protein
MPRLCGIDHFVDLQHGGDRDCFAVGVELRDLVLVVFFALDRPVGSVVPQAAPPKRSRKQKVDTDAASMDPAPANSSRTPLRIPYGNKEVALKLGARYGSEGWYAPPGVDLSAFGERGWL